MKAKLEKGILIFEADNDFDREFMEFITEYRPEIIIYAVNINGIDTQDNMFVTIASGAIEVGSEGR